MYGIRWRVPRPSQAFPEIKASGEEVHAKPEYAPGDVPGIPLKQGWHGRNSYFRKKSQAMQMGLNEAFEYIKRMKKMPSETGKNHRARQPGESSGDHIQDERTKDYKTSHS